MTDETDGGRILAKTENKSMIAAMNVASNRMDLPIFFMKASFFTAIFVKLE